MYIFDVLACVLFDSAALGPGWCIGFLGLLHMDVFKQRLEQEFDANVIITAPNIPYKGLCKNLSYIIYECRTLKPSTYDETVVKIEPSYTV